MMDRALIIGSTLAVVAVGLPSAFEVAAIGQSNQRTLAAVLLALAMVVGLHAALRRRPLGLRATTAAYGVFGLGLGLFASDKPVPYLLAYMVALIGMNVLAYHSVAFGPVLAAFRGEDVVARRTRGIAMRSLAISGGVLAVSYGGSVALLPLFSLEFGSTDPVIAFATAVAVLGAVLLLALLPDVPRGFLGRVRALLR